MKAFPWPSQEEMGAWRERTFGPGDIAAQGLKLASEVGEVCDAIGKRARHLSGPPEGWDANLRDEVADVVLAAITLAAVEGFDLGTAVASKWIRVQAKYRDQETGDEQLNHE